MQKSGYGKLSFKSINNKVAAVNLMGYTHTDMIATVTCVKTGVCHTLRAVPHSVVTLYYICSVVPAVLTHDNISPFPQWPLSGVNQKEVLPLSHIHTHYPMY